MSRFRLSFTERRRRKLALRVDRLDQLEIRNTITEPISLTALSLGIPTGLLGLGMRGAGGGLSGRPCGHAPGPAGSPSGSRASSRNGCQMCGRASGSMCSTTSPP